MVGVTGIEPVTPAVSM